MKTFSIPAESMMPNILVGDFTVGSLWHYKLHEVQRGDIVMFTFLAPESKKEAVFIKRVIGIPGDEIEQ